MLDYSRGLPNIHQIFKKRKKKILENSDRLKLAFKYTLRVAFRGLKNLKDILFDRKLNKLLSKKELNRVVQRECVMCKYMHIICSNQ